MVQGGAGSASWCGGSHHTSWQTWTPPVCVTDLAPTRLQKWLGGNKQVVSLSIEYNALVVLQVNFFHDHTKVIVCPLMQAITYIDDKKTFRVYRMKLIERFGCSRELFSRLRYACTMVERLLNPRSSGSSASGSHKQRPASTGPGAQANGAAASRPTSAGSSVGQHPEHMGASHHNGRGPYQNPVA